MVRHTFEKLLILLDRAQREDKINCMIYVTLSCCIEEVCLKFANSKKNYYLRVIVNLSCEFYS